MIQPTVESRLVPFPRRIRPAKDYGLPADDAKRMITLVGVGHVFDIGRAVREAILQRRPRVVALELDPVRYQALMSRSRRNRGASILDLLARFQSRIASKYGVEVGDEMVAAARAAQEAGSELALIDDDSREILLRVWKGMAVREKWRLLSSTFIGLFAGKERVEAELQRFYQDERAFLGEFARELPTAKRILVDERDVRMATRLRQLHETKGDIVAVVGQGHVDGILRNLAGLPVQIVHLRELRERAGSPPSTASANVTLHL